MDVSSKNNAALEKSAYSHLEYNFAQALQTKGADLIIGDVTAAFTIQEATGTPLDAKGYELLTKGLVDWQTKLQGVAAQLTEWDQKLDGLELGKAHLTVLHDRVTELRGDQTGYLEDVAGYLKQAKELAPPEATLTPPITALTKPPQTWWQYLKSPFICS